MLQNVCHHLAVVASEQKHLCWWCVGSNEITENCMSRLTVMVMSAFWIRTAKFTKFFNIFIRQRMLQQKSKCSTILLPKCLLLSLTPNKIENEHFHARESSSLTCGAFLIKLLTLLINIWRQQKEEAFVCSLMILASNKSWQSSYL